MNKPIKYPLAKLLNEKGLPGAKYFYDDERHYKLNSNKYTIAEVVMWLYEKHGIWVNIGFSGDESCYLMVTNKIGEIKWNEKGFKSPTEAYEAAIEYTLKNLI